MDTAVVAYLIQRISDYRAKLKYRKAAYNLEYPFARTFSTRSHKDHNG